MTCLCRNLGGYKK